MEIDASSAASSSFLTADYIVFVVFLFVSLLIGVYFGIQSFRRQRRSKYQNNRDSNDGANDLIIGANDANIGESTVPKRKDSKHETNEFLLGNRNMPMLPVSLSILASFLSANTVMGTPGELLVLRPYTE